MKYKGRRRKGKEKEEDIKCQWSIVTLTGNSKKLHFYFLIAPGFFVKVCAGRGHFFFFNFLLHVLFLFFVLKLFVKVTNWSILRVPVTLWFSLFCLWKRINRPECWNTLYWWCIKKANKSWQPIVMNKTFFKMSFSNIRWDKKMLINLFRGD